MPPEQEQAKGALRALAASIAAQPELAVALRARWSPGASSPAAERSDPPLPEEVRSLADRLAETLPGLMTQDPATSLGAIFDEPAGDVLLGWCEASVGRRDVSMSRVLSLA